MCPYGVPANGVLTGGLSWSKVVYAQPRTSDGDIYLTDESKSDPYMWTHVLNRRHSICRLVRGPSRLCVIRCSDCAHFPALTTIALDIQGFFKPLSRSRPYVSLCTRRVRYVYPLPFLPHTHTPHSLSIVLSCAHCDFVHPSIHPSIHLSIHPSIHDIQGFFKPLSRSRPYVSLCTRRVR